MTDDDVLIWEDHMKYLFPNDYERNHILDWLSYTVQHQDDKINHALLVAGKPRIGKDQAGPYRHHHCL